MTFNIGDLVSFNNDIFIVIGSKLILYKKSQRIIKYINAQSITTGKTSSFPFYWLDKLETK